MEEIKENLPMSTGEDLRDLTYEDVEDVGKTTWRVVWKEHWLVMILSIVGGSAFFVLTVYRINEGAIAGFIIPLLIYTSVYVRVQRLFMRSFAEKKNFEFWPYGNTDGQPGVLFSKGHDPETSNVVQGSFNGIDFELYSYAFTVGSGRNKKIHLHTVLATQIPGANFPRTYLDAHEGLFKKGKVPSWRRNGLVRIKLESNDFERRFRLYAPKGSEVAAIELFPTDFMQWLMDNKWETLDFEFVEDMLYVYVDGFITKRDDLIKIFTSTRFLFERLGSYFARRGLGAPRIELLRSVASASEEDPKKPRGRLLGLTALLEKSKFAMYVYAIAIIVISIVILFL